MVAEAATIRIQTILRLATNPPANAGLVFYRPQGNVRVPVIAVMEGIRRNCLRARAKLDMTVSVATKTRR